MSGAGRRPERLQQLAKIVGIPQCDPFACLIRPPVPQPSAEDLEVVEKALSETRPQNSDNRRWYWRSSGSNTTYTRGEATQALDKLVRSRTGCSPGQASELIRKGADIVPRSNKRWHRSRSQDHGEIRNSIFLHIVENTNVALINAVAHEADLAHLNAALKRAFVQSDSDKIWTLLAIGCDPTLVMTGSHSNFGQPMADTTNSLSARTSLITAKTATECLSDAMKLCDLQVIRVLLALNADADTNGSFAMINAVAYKLMPIMVALCLAPHSPSPDNLAAILKALCDKHRAGPISEPVLMMAEIMLAAGAQGTQVSEALFNATSRTQYALVELLAEYTGFDRESDSAALRIAMKSGDLHMFLILMRKAQREDVDHVITQDITDNLMNCLTTECRRVPPEIRLKMIESLCRLKPSSAMLNKALVVACEFDETEAIAILVSQEACVHHESGDGFFAAINNQSIKAFCTLLRKPCPETTLQSILNRTRDLPIALRLQFVRGLLKVGIWGEAVDGALYAATRDYDGSVDGQKLIDLLVQSDADVNQSNGKCLLLAGQHEDVTILKTLLRGSPNASSLERAFGSVLHVEDFELKLSLVNLILDAGAKGETIDRALCTEIDGSIQGRRFAELILRRGEPNVNFEDGKAVMRAVEYQEVELLQLLTGHEPSLDVIGRALLRCIQRLVCDVTPSGGRDMRQIQTLLSFHGAVDYGSGKSIIAAIARSDDELLSVLLKAHPESETLYEGLKYILDKFRDEDRKLKLAQLLLNTGTKIPPESLGRLLHQTFGSSGDEKLLQLFLDAGASVNIGTMEAFKVAIEQNDHSVLRLLLIADATAGTVATMFDYAWNSKDIVDVELLKVFTNEVNFRCMIDFDQYLAYAVQSGPRLSHIIEYLLGLDASVESCGNECLHIAGLNLDIETLSLLLPHVRNRSSVTDVFRAVMSKDAVWLDPSGVLVVEKLLSHGASGDVVDHSLLLAVERYSTHVSAKGILEHLVDYQASPDYEDGLALEKAVRQGSLELVTKIFDIGPSVTTIANAFPYIFTSSADVQIALALVDAFVQYSDIESYINTQHKELEPVLFLSLKTWPRNVAMVQALLDAGASGDQRWQCRVMWSNQLESVTPLLWALCQPKQIISDAVVTSLVPVSGKDQFVLKVKFRLLTHRIDVNFASDDSMVSPLIAATHSCRTEIVELLLAKSANSSPDRRGWTPLCYASLQDDVSLSKSLLRLGGHRDDGSLHHAVSHCKVAQALLLLEDGHNPNSLSKTHGSLPAMAVLIMHQDKPHSFQDMKRMFELLHKYGANPHYQCDGKSLLFMALDTHEAEDTVSALLEAFMGTMVNSDFNLYHNKEEVVYSPLSYVIHDQQESGNYYKGELSNVLRAFGCEQVYYRKVGRQPPDFKGAPESIREAERQRIQLEETTAEEEERHQLELRRRQEIDRADVEKRNQAHAAEMERRLDAEKEWQLAAQRNHRLQLARENEAAEAQQRKLKYARMINDEEQRNLALKRERDLLLLHQHNMSGGGLRMNTEYPLTKPLPLVRHEREFGEREFQRYGASSSVDRPVAVLNVI